MKFIRAEGEMDAIAANSDRDEANTQPDNLVKSEESNDGWWILYVDPIPACLPFLCLSSGLFPQMSRWFLAFLESFFRHDPPPLPIILTI